MVKPDSIPTYETWDIQPEQDGRVRRVMLAESTGDYQPIQQFRRARRIPKVWEITGLRADPGTLWRLDMIWQRSARGALPIAFAPPELGGTIVPVVIVEDTLLTAMASPAEGSFSIRLEQWFG